ncbi:MAG TPA: M28 family peptidase [Nitrolancea sp.]|nr:M28 family peptidase [Nitrolancea sp.]
MSQTIADLEKAVRGQVSAEHLQEHLNQFSTLFRDTGSEDERKAAEYIVEQMRGYGVEAEILEFDSLISWPLEGKLALIDSAGNETESLEVRTRAFGAQTPPGGVVAELVFVPFAAPRAGEMIFSHRAVAGDYSGLDVRGKMVISQDGGPDGVLRAQERGAAGHIHIWPSDESVTHEMICTSIWGTPTPESAGRIPTIPSMGVKNSIGNRLAEMLKSGPVQVRVESNVETKWRRVPLATSFIPSSKSDDFLLVGAHIDSWYEGVTDNATGDAALIEMARVLSGVRGDLNRGVRFCWWPGHSTGRYSGSTWFADNAFAELRDHALGYLNIDSPGVRETEIWDCRYNMGEIEHITGSVVKEQSGQEPNLRRPLRAGDQSFLGVGLPSLGAFRMLPVDHPDRKAVGGGGGAYWWHSPEDTLEKADAAILARDVEVYVSITLRMTQPDVIPYRFTPSAQDFIDQLTTLQNAAGEHLDLSSTLAAANRYHEAAEKLTASPIDDTATLNEGLKQISRVVNPVLFTVNGPYDMDPALQMGTLPGLAQIGQLLTLDASSSDYRFLRTKLVRQKNRIEDALEQATKIAQSITA